ncbi:hypothetical protein Lfu02_71690 [Longispora fulva]|uniref:Uncharacterized protein n=1 Tax=Longispora fulva TaxID=619741 RepID=A0A8J7KTX0_9ACTN|nr:hypothetical protein [Longispora fulva]MBG6141207.1 hypothetical protein [Longispora fulva]GIG62797.1 hypothetical protein Lfu02_71690 [Longispora fulva]
MPDLLRRLDQRVVPMLASALRRAAGGRHRRGVLAAVGMTLAVAVVLAAVLSAREALPGRGHAAGTPLRVGVSDGDSIPAYVAGARERLAGVDRPTLALVSLAAYLGPDRLGPLLENARPSRVYLRVPLPGISTEVIAVDVRQLPGDVVAGMDAAAVRKEEEVAIATRLAGRLTGDSPRERELREEYQARAAEAGLEATAYREHCSCVYAAVVRAGPPALAELSRRPGVRAVDPTPGLDRLEQAVFRPPIPEQHAIASDPADVPVSPSPTPAPRPSVTRTPPPSAPPTGPMPEWPASPTPSQVRAPSPSPER